jgi:DNA polymerase I-like protein with 3'-5' exonuclease and polymerase domains
MFYADLQAAESRATAYLSGDEGYINAVESSDLHTEVAKMVWPNMGWTEDNVQNRTLAERPYYGNFSYRDVCKRAGHGTNYGASANTVARHTKIKVAHATRFQLLYFGGIIPLASLERWHKQDKKGGFDELMELGEKIGSGTQVLVRVAGAFPGIRTWHTEVIKELQLTGNLVTPFGRRRQFWGRLDDEHYARKAIAYLPQSTIGDLLNKGLYRVWSELFTEGVEILGQVHDAVLGQCPNDKVDYLIPKVIDCLENPIDVKGRSMIIPSDAEVGDSWKNLKKWVANA